MKNDQEFVVLLGTKGGPAVRPGSTMPTSSLISLGGQQRKDLGHVIEFKTEIQITFEISSNSEIGMSYNHISNASLGDKNPGANSYMINFIKKY